MVLAAAGVEEHQGEAGPVRAHEGRRADSRDRGRRIHPNPAGIRPAGEVLQRVVEVVDGVRRARRWTPDRDQPGRRRRVAPDQLPIDVGRGVLDRERVVDEPRGVEHRGGIGRVFGHEGRQALRRARAREIAQRRIERVGRWIVSGVAVKVMGDSAQLGRVETVQVLLHDVALEPGGLRAEQDGRRGQVGSFNRARNGVQGLPVTCGRDPLHGCAFGGAEDARLPLAGREIGFVLNADPIGHHPHRSIGLQRTRPPVAEICVGIGAAVLDESAGRNARPAAERGSGDSVALEVSGWRPGGHEDLGRRAPPGSGGLLDDLHGVAVIEGGGRVGLALVLVPVPQPQDVETGVDEEDVEDVVGAAREEIGLVGGRSAESLQGLVGHGGVDRD